MNLVELLELKYPGRVGWNKDIQIIDRNDGNGLVIGEWSAEDPMPTDEELAQWYVDYAQQYATNKKQEQFLIVNAEIITKLADIDTRSIRALRTNDVPRLASLEAEAATLRLQLVK